MSSNLFIITPESAAGSGGLADHTLALLQQWRTTERFNVLAAKPDGTPGEVAKVQQLGTTAAAILSQLPQTGARVFVQYSAYGFNRLGYPRDLIRALIDWRKRNTGGRLVMMFHEIWTFWPVINKNFIVQQLHRRAIKHLLGVCDAVFTTTASQAEHLRKLRRGAAVQVLPVGSNVQRAEPLRVDRDHHCAVLFGLQATRIRALEQLHKTLAAFAAQGRITRIVSVGYGSNVDAARRERELLESLNLSAGFEQVGALPTRELSAILNSAAFGIFGQNELSCQKSGSFMAYAAHQMSVIAEFAEPTKAPPICWLVAPSELLHGISQSELDHRAECLWMWQRENCSWEVIGNRLGRALGINAARSGGR